MNRFVAAAGALLALGLTASVATAAPLSGVGKLTAGANADLVQVHGMHRECVRGRWGWHRSTPWGGRLECRPQWKRWHVTVRIKRSTDPFASSGQALRSLAFFCVK